MKHQRHERTSLAAEKYRIITRVLLLLPPMQYEGTSGPFLVGGGGGGSERSGRLTGPSQTGTTNGASWYTFVCCWSWRFDAQLQ